MVHEGYDYDKQAWIENGVYVRCGHPESMPCSCYGREHEGEKASTEKPWYEDES